MSIRDVEWAKIRKLIIIILLILLFAYITIRSVILVNDFNKRQEIEIEEMYT